jgi:hypothetical protein
MIQVTGIKTATNANVLASTDLQSAPGPGVYLFWCASSQADTVITITAPPSCAARNINPHLRTNGVPMVSDDSPVAVAVRGGEQVALQMTIVTAATFGYVVKFIPKEEM